MPVFWSVPPPRAICSQPPRTLSQAQSSVFGRMALLTLAPRPLPCWICSVLPTRCISRQYICPATTTTSRQHSTPRPCVERVEGTDVVEAGPAVCLDDLIAARRAEAEEEACPQRYCCHLEKNATQTAATSWRLTALAAAVLDVLRDVHRRGGAVAEGSEHLAVRGLDEEEQARVRDRLAVQPCNHRQPTRPLRDGGQTETGWCGEG